MSKYYFMVEETSMMGVPIDLEGTLQVKVVPKETYMRDGGLPPVHDSFPWRMGWLNTAEMPEKLYLINCHRKIDFDLYKKNGGFIFSEDFKQVFDTVAHPEYIATPLEVVNRDGEKNTVKNYWYIVIKQDCEAIDFDKSQFKQTNIPDGRFGSRFLTVLKYGSKLILNNKLFSPNDIFFINQSYFKNYLFCSENFKEEVEKKKIKTIRFIEIENFITYFNQTYRSLSPFKQMKFIVEQSE